jgi:hypothetical protein
MAEITDEELLMLVNKAMDLAFCAWPDTAVEADLLASWDSWHLYIERALSDRGFLNIKPVLGLKCNRPDLINYTIEEEILSFTDGRTIVTNKKTHEFRVIRRA